MPRMEQPKWLFFLLFAIVASQSDWVWNSKQLRLHAEDGTHVDVSPGQNLLELFAKIGTMFDDELSSRFIAHILSEHEKAKHQPVGDDQRSDWLPPKVTAGHTHAFYVIGLHATPMEQASILVLARTLRATQSQASLLVMMCQNEDELFRRKLVAIGAIPTFCSCRSPPAPYGLGDASAGLPRRDDFLDAYNHPALLEYSSVILLGIHSLFTGLDPDVYFSLPHATATGDVSAPLSCDFVVRQPSQSEFQDMRQLYNSLPLSPFSGWNNTGWPKTLLGNAYPLQWATCQGFFLWYYRDHIQSLHSIPPELPLPHLVHDIYGTSWRQPLHDVRLFQVLQLSPTPYSKWQDANQSLMGLFVVIRDYRNAVLTSLEHVFKEAISAGATLSALQEFLALENIPLLSFDAVTPQCVACMCCCGDNSERLCLPVPAEIRELVHTAGEPSNLLTVFMREYHIRNTPPVEEYCLNYQDFWDRDAVILNDTRCSTSQFGRMLLQEGVYGPYDGRQRVRTRNEVGWSDWSEWTKMVSWNLRLGKEVEGGSFKFGID